MKDIGRLLRDGDPVALEPEMSAADVQAVRRAVLAALATHRSGDEPRGPGRCWPARRSPRRSPPACSSGSETPAPRVSPIETALDPRLGRRGRASSTAVRVARRDTHHLGLQSGVQSMKRINVMHRLGSLGGFGNGDHARRLQQRRAVARLDKPRGSRPQSRVAPASPQGYSVVLVLGDMQTTSADDGNVPAPRARRWRT